MTRLRALVALALAAVAIAGCNGDDDEPVAGGSSPQPGAGGTLKWALPERPVTLDPLYARTHSERLVARQIFEPPVSRLAGPFDDPRRVPGVVRVVRQTKDPTVWRIVLRRGVRFGDGSPVNAAAVLANAERWQQVPGRSGLPAPPELFVFAPKPPYEVRFKLAKPDPDFERKLASPALGLVSPDVLERADGRPLGQGLLAGAGSGPFELRERGEGVTLLARNAEWWGSGLALGPEIDQLEFTAVPAEADSSSMLTEGTVQVASGLSPLATRTLAEDPLLAVVSEDEGIVAERSVRGIPPTDPVPPLNGVWLTQIRAN